MKTLAIITGQAYKDPGGRHAPTYGKGVQIKLELRVGHDDKPWWFITEGAVTGYESLSAEYLEQENEMKPGFPDGWSACSGTPGRWASLLVTGPTCMMMLAVQRQAINS